MIRYTAVVEDSHGCNICVRMGIDIDEKEARKTVWASMCDEEKNSCANLEIVECEVLTSDLNGEGYGDKHYWSRGEAYQWGRLSGRSEDAHCVWRCKVCTASFVHWYHLKPDIHQTMIDAQVPETCTEAGILPGGQELCQ